MMIRRAVVVLFVLTLASPAFAAPFDLIAVTDLSMSLAGGSTGVVGPFGGWLVATSDPLTLTGADRVIVTSDTAGLSGRAIVIPAPAPLPVGSAAGINPRPSDLAYAAYADLFGGLALNPLEFGGEWVLDISHSTSTTGGTLHLDLIIGTEHVPYDVVVAVVAEPLNGLVVFNHVARFSSIPCPLQGCTLATVFEPPPSQAPEPTSLVLLATGLVGLYRRRR